MWKIGDAKSPLVGLVEDIAGNILDVIRAELLTESRHGTIAAGQLLDDGTNFVLAIGHQSLLLDLLLSDNGVVATSMAGGAVTVEDSHAVVQVCCHGRTSSHHSSQQAHGSTQGQWTE